MYIVPCVYLDCNISKQQLQQLNVEYFDENCLTYLKGKWYAPKSDFNKVLIYFDENFNCPSFISIPEWCDISYPYIYRYVPTLYKTNQYGTTSLVYNNEIVKANYDYLLWERYEKIEYKDYTDHFVLCNIPLSSYQHLGDTGLGYDIIRQKFMLDTQDITFNIQNLIWDIQSVGLQNPLLFEVGYNGSIVAPKDCSHRLLIALLIDLQYVPGFLWFREHFDTNNIKIKSNYKDEWVCNTLNKYLQPSIIL